MTPAVYKKGGKDLKIEYAIVKTELGKLLIARTEKGICAVTFGDDNKTLFENLQNEFSKAEIVENDKNLKNLCRSDSGKSCGNK